MKLPSRAIAVTIMFSTILVNAPLRSISAEDNLTKSRQSIVNSRDTTIGDQPHQDRKLSPLLQNQKSESKLDESPPNSNESESKVFDCFPKCSNNHSQPPTFISPSQIIKKAVSELPILLKAAKPILLPVLIMLGIVAGCIVWKILMDICRLALRKSLNFPRQ